MGSDKTKCFFKWKCYKRDTEQFFDTGMIVQFSNADGFLDGIELIPAVQCHLSGAFQKIGREKKTQQAGQVAVEAFLPVRHEIPEAYPRITTYIPVIPGVMFHVKHWGPFMIWMSNNSETS